MKNLAEIKVGLLMGGLSGEREVSLMTGEAIFESLTNLGVDTVKIDAGRDLCKKIEQEKIDLAFIALHGKYGEDGCVQGALEIMDIPYTGSGVAASAVAMDKALTKAVATSAGVRTPKAVTITRDEFKTGGNPATISTPVVVKPSAGGSSIGVTICHTDNEIEGAISLALKEGDTALIETFIDGPLITIGVVGDKTLPPIEIEPVGGFYDYERKYTPGQTVYHIPARIKGDVAEEAAEMVMKMHRTLGCRGVTRSEVIVDSEERCWFIELNTIPGMTKTSLLPKAASEAGLSFDDLTRMIIEDAVR